MPRGHQHGQHVEADQRLVRQQHERRAGIAERGQPRAERAREPTFRRRVDDRRRSGCAGQGSYVLVSRGDDRMQIAQQARSPGAACHVQGIRGERPAAKRGEQFRAPEPAGAPGGEDQPRNNSACPWARLSWPTGHKVVRSRVRVKLHNGLDPHSIIPVTCLSP